MRRRPLVTAALTAVTAATALAQAIEPSLLARLERTHASLHGQEWRLVTTLFVQDGGVAGALSNLVFLVVIGAVAEQLLSRRMWLALYVGVGVGSQLVAYDWQPVGGGNSVAVCGLAGAVAVSCWREVARIPEPAPAALLLWCGAVLATLPGRLSILFVAAGVAGAGAARARPRRAHRAAAAAVAVTGAALAAATNVHGAALLFGLLGTVSIGAFGSPHPQKPGGTSDGERALDQSERRHCRQPEGHRMLLLIPLLIRPLVRLVRRWRGRAAAQTPDPSES
ncbi:MAG TPA: rhomboid family intramembrane serine protease [Gaiellaceae bacterium]|nr:rhomboid family intramembrane serine protease [Gaiellaceae bacterium]